MLPEKGKSRQWLQPGDLVHIPPNMEHWHGASSTNGLAHIAITNHSATGLVIWQQPVTDAEYQRLVQQAKHELAKGIRPALKTGMEKIAAYQLIFIGSPVWWYTVAPPVWTFLTTHDLSDKIIAPFCTHAGSSLLKCATDIARLSPQATVLPGVAFWGRDAKTSPAAVCSWLQQLQLLENIA